MDWPLLVQEEAISEAVKKFYPQVRCVHLTTLPPILLLCNTRPHLNAALGLLSGYEGKTLWLPHGLSDKGGKGLFFEALEQEDLLLIYGQKMRTTLLDKAISRPTFSIGNFRYLFYQKHRAFYDQMIDAQFGTSRFILYAPTWEDMEGNGTFWQAFPILVASLPSHLLLLVKIHPNTQKRFTAELERCKGLAEKKGNIILVDDFPPIYPLLNRADAYIGDRSSIGYDFLYMKRPLYFLCQKKVDPESDPSALLMQCGEQIRLDELPALLNRPNLCTLSQPFLEKIEQMTRYAFDPTDDFVERLQRVIYTERDSRIGFGKAGA
jgi:hypothetical protein